MKSVNNTFYLLGIGLRAQWRMCVEFIRVVRRYYSNPQFRRLDLDLARRYLFGSPYRISKQFLKRQGVPDIHTYGETPLTTLDHISKECGFAASDTVYDLGCGPGRTTLWLHQFIGCQAIGIEQVPLFVHRAQRVIKKRHLNGIEFKQADMRAIDYQGATAIYLYGSCFGGEFLRPLIEKLRHLNYGAKIITVSYELNEFTPQPYFKRLKQFSARFTWGEAQVFLQTPEK